MCTSFKNTYPARIPSLLSHLVERQFTKEQNQQEFSRALATLEVKGLQENRKATIELYSVKVNVEDYFFGAETEAKEYLENKVKEQELFRRFFVNGKQGAGIHKQ